MPAAPGLIVPSTPVRIGNTIYAQESDNFCNLFSFDIDTKRWEVCEGLDIGQNCDNLQNYIGKKYGPSLFYDQLKKLVDNGLHDNAKIYKMLNWTGGNIDDILKIMEMKPCNTNEIYQLLKMSGGNTEGILKMMQLTGKNKRYIVKSPWMVHNLDLYSDNR